MKINILITGATGFIGKEILKQIKTKKNIRALCITRKTIKPKIYSKNISWIKSSLKLSKKNFEKIKKFQPVIVFHLAWKNIPNFNKKNSFENLWDSASFFLKIFSIKSIKKVIVSGSCFEYKIQNNKKKETDQLNFKDNFSLAKNILFYFISNLSSKKKIRLAWFRIFYAFGENQRENSLIPYLIKRIKYQKIIKLKNKNTKIDYINVCEISKVFLSTIKINFKSGAYNLGTGTAQKIEDIAENIAKILKKKIPMIKYNKQLIKDQNFFSCTKKSSIFFKLIKKKNFYFYLKRLLLKK